MGRGDRNTPSTHGLSSDLDTKCSSPALGPKRVMSWIPGVGMVDGAPHSSLVVLMLNEPGNGSSSLLFFVTAFKPAMLAV